MSSNNLSSDRNHRYAWEDNYRGPAAEAHDILHDCCSWIQLVDHHSNSVGHNKKIGWRNRENPVAGNCDHLLDRRSPHFDGRAGAVEDQEDTENGRDQDRHRAVGVEIPRSILKSQEVEEPIHRVAWGHR
jgi:hypothetical protein